MPIALSSEPCARTTEATSPSTISEKYSAGRTSARRWPAAAASAITAVASVPATNEPTAAVVSATPARPVLAIR